MSVEQPEEVEGFRYTVDTGTRSGLAAYRRGCKARNEVPDYVHGNKGPGRTRHVRTYTVSTRRLLDGAELSETVGPAYWSKKRWAKERAKAHLRLVGRLREMP